MAGKKQKKTAEQKAKKKKKTIKFAMLVGSALLGVAIAAFLILTYSGPLTSTSSGEKEKIKAELYFSDSNERFLSPESRFILKGKSQPDQVTELVNALIEGPKTGLVRTIPEKTKLINARVDTAGTATVNFDNSFLAEHPGGSSSEIATIYSLTNSICRNIPDIKKVKILVEGKEMETLKGHIDARFPFSPNMDLVAKGSIG